MEEIKVTVAIENSGNNLETSEEEKLRKAEEERQKKLQEIKETNEKVREEARKARRASRPMFATKIRSMVKTINESYDETEIKTMRIVLRVFLKDLASHKTGRHATIVKRLQEAMRERELLRLSENDALILAEAAVRYEISFVRLKEDKPVHKM